MKKILKYAVYGVIILVVIWGVIGYINSKNAPLVVKTVKPERRDIVTEITSSGKIQSKESYSLNFNSAGLLNYLPFEEGDNVKKGQVVARLQSNDLYQSTLKSEADYRLALEKIRDFEFTNKDKPKDDKYWNARWQLDAQADSSKALYDSAKSAQGNKVLVSPIDGVITQINTKPGEISSAATPVMTVAKLDDLEFVAEVDEQDAARLQESQSAEITLDAFNDKKFTGTIFDISRFAKTNSTGGTYYPTKITLTSIDPGIRSGMNGDATIQTAKNENVLAVPSETIVEDDKSKFVYVIENGKAKKVTVTVGLENDTHSEILSGLNEGSEVIIPESDTLKEGIKVAKAK